MSLTTLTCPSCGAPVAPGSSAVTTCAYCSRAILGAVEASWALRMQQHEMDDALDPRPWCRVDGVKYLVEGQLGAGETFDVFLGERARRPTERVILRVGRGPGALRPIDYQWKRLGALERSKDRRTPMMTTLLPQLVAKGTLNTRTREGLPVLVTRWRSGYQYTLVDVLRAYPDGIDAQTAVWIWRRILDLLSWLHDNGIAHGSVRPEHVLLHPRDHGAVLVGWSHAATLARTDDAIKEVAESAESIRFALGGQLPLPLQAVLDGALRGREADAASLGEKLRTAARDAFGPPAYHPFTMPD